MKKLFTLILLGILFFPRLNAQSFVKAVFPGDRFETVLGNQVPFSPFTFFADNTVLSDGAGVLAYLSFVERGPVEKNYLTLYKIDSNGDSVWTRSMDLGDSHILRHELPILTSTQDGGFLLFSIISSNGDLFYLLQKFNGGGSLIWSKRLELAPSINPFPLNSFERPDGRLTFAFNVETNSHSNGVIDYSGLLLFDFDGDGNFLEKKYYLRSQGSEYSFLYDAKMDATGGIYAVGYEDLRNPHSSTLHNYNPLVLRIDSADNLSFSKILDGGEDFQATELTMLGGKALVGITRFFPLVLTEIDGSGNLSYTHILEEDGYALDEHQPYRMVETSFGASIFAVSPSFNQDVTLDLSEGFSASIIRLDVDDKGDVFRTQGQNGGNFLHRGLGAASDGGSNIQLAYPTYYLEEPIGGSDFIRGFHLSRVFPLPDPGSLCYGPVLDTREIPGSFSESNANFQGPLNPSQASSLIGTIPNFHSIVSDSYSVVDDSSVMITFCNSSAAQPFTKEDEGDVATKDNNEIFRTYPSPFRQRMTLEMMSGIGEVEMRVQDLSGRIFMEEKMNGEEGSQLEMDMSGLEAGIYILTLKGRDFMFRKKVVKASR